MKPLRFLFTGDFQIRAWKQFSITLPNGMNSRLANCLKVFEIARREAKRRGIQKFLGNGDFFDETDYISVEVYDAAYREVEKNYDAGLETALNIGNHDISSQSGGRVLHSLRPFRKVATILEKPTRLWDHIQVVPYMDNPKEFKATVARLDAAPCLVLHCGVQGATTGPNSYLVRNPIKLRDIRPKDFRLVLLSDYHTTQWLRSNVLYVGSPLQHSFGEIHRPCIWDVTILDSSPYYRLEKIPTKLPRFRKFRVNDRERLDRLLSQYRGDYLRLVLPADSRISDEEVEKRARLVGCLFQIERQGDGVSDEAHENVHALEPNSAMAKYVRSAAKKARRSRLLTLGRKLYEGGE